jgi:L-histidine Nalpha-methyltransferase
MTVIRKTDVLISPIAEDVLQGLSATPKRLPPKLFYDAEGSRLFEEITRTPEYYPTRTERGILESFAGEMVSAAGSNLTLVELGAGSACKTKVVIRAILRRQLRLEFHPVDVSPAALKEAVASLNGDFPNLHVSPIVADYGHQLPDLRSRPGRKLVLFIGSTIGNFEPDEAAAFLSNVKASLQRDDALLLGFDMVKDAKVLHAAYNDAQGVTEAFNKNVLARINREFGGQFDLKQFRHVAFWNKRNSRIEMHLESRVEQKVRIQDLGRTFQFADGERIHTENSYKFTEKRIERLLRQAGLELQQMWCDGAEWFSVVLARA